MTQSSTMYIAFPHGGRIPADIAGGKERAVGPHEAVKVPKGYGDSLVADRFAYETSLAAAKAASGSRQQETESVALREASLKKAEAALAGRESALIDREAKIIATEKDLDERVSAAAEIEASIAGREAAVKATEDGLADREAAVAKAESELTQVGKLPFNNKA